MTIKPGQTLRLRSSKGEEVQATLCQRAMTPGVFYAQIAGREGIASLSFRRGERGDVLCQGDQLAGRWRVCRRGRGGCT